MAGKMNRRQALAGVSSAALLPAACATGPVDQFAVKFRHGVASGDPDHSSVVIWTRISGVDTPVPVDWYVATDEDFRNIVARGRLTASAQRDYTAKVLADGLMPGTTYYYQFSVGNDVSPAGRTWTLPDGHITKLTMGVVSCSNWPFGYFNAYEAIANDDEIDLVVHLGDYIYEYDIDGYGGPTGKRIGRMHEPPHETVTLADYRTRHAQYKTDDGSKAMLSRHPLVCIWDDHESTNNPWMGGAQNHQPDEGDWHRRRADSLQAYFEWMPIRDPAPGQPLQEYWRHYKFGDLASLITLESRHTGRTIQAEYGDLSRFDGPTDAQAFYDDVVGRANREFLSEKQRAFLGGELRESVQSPRAWRVIGNQSIIAKSVLPHLDEPIFDTATESLNDYEKALVRTVRRLGELGLPAELDEWNGYPAARERFYQLASNSGVRDLLVITGDSHAFWANRLTDNAGGSMGVEIGTTGVTSPRSFHSIDPAGLERFDELFNEKNPDIHWQSGLYRGYVRLTLTHDHAVAEFNAISDVESRTYDVNRVYRSVIVKSGESLTFA